MIFDEFSMFDFRGFFLSRLIVCDLNMPHDCLFNTISSCLCCLQIFARQISTMYNQNGSSKNKYMY